MSENQSNSGPKIVAIIPAYNEEKTLLRTIDSIKKIKYDTEIIIADDCSTDKTFEIAKKSGVSVLKLDRNSGKGTAVNKAVGTLRNRNFDILLMIDADIGESACEVEKLIEPIIKNNASMVIAKIPLSVKKSGFGIVRWLARNSVKWKTGYEVEAPLSGQRAVVFKDIIDYKFKSGYGLEVGMTVDFLKMGKKIVEVEANMLHTGTGKDVRGFMHRGRQFYDILKTIWFSR